MTKAARQNDDTRPAPRPSQSPTRRLARSTGAASALALAAFAGGLGSTTSDAHAQAQLGILQIFEIQWLDLERRVPDVFLGGYNGLWIPQPGLAGFQSVGYDVFDRFDLGQPPLSDNSFNRKRTTYGTEATFRAMVQEMRRANVQVFPDAVLNHNSGRTTDYNFYAAGGYPGFHVPLPNPARNLEPTDDWGDFHGGVAGGYLQSEDPGGPRYNLWEGDLVALVDINQFDSNFFIRHPTTPGDPQNIPAGTERNLPDASNARFYPDLSLAPDTFTNPSSNHSGSDFVTRYPFNLSDPMAGDPVPETPGQLLGRWAQWMLQVQGVDGFRLDASKHTFPGFWDFIYDSSVFLGRTRADGVRVTPFTFGENTAGNGDILFNYFRKDGFANRDSLDLSGAGSLRNLINAGGFGNWNDVFPSHLDTTDDGFQNGSAGVFHVFSHDNGTLDGPAALPSDRSQGWFAHAYTQLRPGVSIVYHNAKGVPRSSGFFPDEGTPVALGWNPNTLAPEDVLTNLNHIRNTYAFAQYVPLDNGADTLIFERSIPFQGGRSGNLLVATNDRYDVGFDQRTVQTSFPQGTRLHELTGNAADPMVDPSNSVPDILVVGNNGFVTVNVPRNTSTAGEHNKGFVAYGPPTPITDVTIVGASSVLPPDPVSFPDHLQRLATIPVVTTDAFTLRLETQVRDAIDGVTDDNALFRIDAGAGDWNGSGGPDFPLSQSVIGGYEQFTDVNQPGMGGGPAGPGLYEQVIDATRLSEGFHYISGIAFRQRPSGTTPLFGEDREVVCIDRVEAPLELVSLGDDDFDPRPTWEVVTPDGTVERVHTYLNLAPGSDPVALADIFNAARRFDRNQFQRTFDTDLLPGENTVTVVAFESCGRAVVREFQIVFGDASCNPADLAEPFGQLTFGDISVFLAAFSAQDPSADLAAPFGQFTFGDISAFLAAFSAGCP
jgi:alpha-amylase